MTENASYQYIMSVITTEDDMREPTTLGMIYRNTLSGKTYSVDTLFFEKKGVAQKAIFSIQEVTHPDKLRPEMLRTDFVKTGLKCLDASTEKDLFEFLNAFAKKSPVVLLDRRDVTNQKGISPNGVLVCMPR